MYKKLKLNITLVIISQLLITKSGISIDNTDERSTYEKSFENSSIVLNEISLETIEKRYEKYSDLESIPQWHVSASWNPDISYSYFIRNERRNQYFEYLYKDDELYAFVIIFPSNFKDIESNEQRYRDFYIKTINKNKHCQYASHSRARKIFKNDVFMECIACLHKYVYNLQNTEKKQPSYHKTIQNEHDDLFLDFFNAYMPYTEVCALNYLINYFLKERTINSAFIFTDYLKVRTINDSLLKLQFLFNFKLPPLQKQEETLKRKFIDFMNLNLSNSFSDLMPILSAPENFFKLNDKIYGDDYTKFRHFFLSFFEFLKIKISDNSSFFNRFNDLWLDSTGSKRTVISFFKPEHYEDYIEYFKDIKILENSYCINIFTIKNIGFFGINVNNINFLLEDILYLKINCEQMLFLTYKLYIISKYQKVFAILDEIDYKLAILKSLASKKTELINFFSNSTLFSDFNNMRIVQLYKLKEDINNVTSTKSLEININDPDKDEIQTMITKQTDYFDILINYLKIENDQCSLFHNLTKKVKNEIRKITNRDINYKEFNEMRLYYLSFMQKHTLDVIVSDYVHYDIEDYKYNDQKYENYLKLYNKLTNEKSFLFCLYQKIAIALDSLLLDANEVTKILNHLKIIIKNISKDELKKTSFG